MPKKNLTPFEQINEQIEKQQEMLDQLGETYSKHLEKIWSQETSLERMNDLYEKANEKVKKMEEFQRDNQAALNDYTRALQEAENISNEIVRVQNEIKQKQKDINNATDPAIIKKLRKELQDLRDEQTDLNNDLQKEKDIIEVTLDYREHEKEAIEASDKAQQEFNRRQEEGLTFLDDWAEKTERNTKALRKGAKEIGEGLQKAGKAAWDMLEPWRKANHEAMAYARSMGVSQKTADAYLKKTLSWAASNNIGILFNKSTDELIKLQGKYSEVLGRNVQLTSEQKKDMLAMEKFLGEDGMMDIANNLENFGLGMSDSADFIKETMDEATKSGIAASKLTKTIQENIKMAQNYTFKNGLDGLRSMAQKAIELKTDMSLINSMLETTSTVEGAITTGAKLQVLGGSYALGSDPLSMMYESLNDAEGMFDRVTNMAKGKVYYNSNTGNFEMGAMDRYMMKQAATAMGVDPTKLLDVAFRQASLGRIEGQARMNSNIAGDKDMINLVKNLATWDNGEAVIDINGEKRAVSALTQDDKSKLESMQRTDSQNLQEMAISLRSMNEKIEGIQKEALNEQANITKNIADRVNGIFDNTKLMNRFAQIMAISKLTLGGFEMIAGGFMTVQGLLHMLVGGFNTGSGGAPLFRGRRGGATGRRLAQTASNHGWKGVKRALGTIGPRAFAGSAAVGLMGGALSLGSDALSGDLQRDTGASIGDALGTTVGGAIGMFFGGPLGAMLGSTIGGLVTDGIQKAQKEHRAQIRDRIASELGATLPHVAALFSGPDALAGNYKERHLNDLKNALMDGTISNGELSKGILRKARANGDLARMQNSGINIQVPLASGGYLEGNSHSNGGMPILGSNIVVEGGEYVINKNATQRNLPLLNEINSGNYSMSALEPLGKQLKVHRGGTSGGSYMPHNNINVAPINLNLSGTIKLDLGTSKQIDITNDLVSNPLFVKKLTDMISKQINIYDNGAYNKAAHKQKFI